MNEQYEVVPNMISCKDLDYLSDMFNWNYGAYKNALNASNSVEDDEIKTLLTKCADNFYSELQNILNILNQGGTNE